MEQSGTLARGDEENTDRITELPNSILSSIISLLTIKDAVDSSMISPRWRNLWLHPILTRSNLEFDIPNMFGSRYSGPKSSIFECSHHLRLIRQFPRQDFVRRVNSFLQLYRGQKVDSFKLAFFFDGESAAVLDGWIRFAITKGAQVLDIQLYWSTNEPDYAYVFPHWLLSEVNLLTLKHLSLVMCVLKPPPDFDRFSQLKTLCLSRVTVAPKFMARLFCVCLLLESLTLKDCNCVGATNFIVAGPLLRLNELKLFLCPRELERIEISAPNLVSFEYNGNIQNVSFVKTPQLARIYFMPSKDRFAYALTQFASFGRLETLHLHMLPGVVIPQSVPRFRNLKQLNLDVLSYKGRRDDVDLSPVLNLLMVTPLLEELVITVCGLKFNGNQREMRNLSGFTHNYLKKVRIQGFQSNSYEIEFATCILQNAVNLKFMVIDPLGKIYVDGEWMDIISIYGSNPWWDEIRREVVREKLNEVKTNAQILIL